MAASSSSTVARSPLQRDPSGEERYTCSHCCSEFNVKAELIHHYLMDDRCVSANVGSIDEKKAKDLNDLLQDHSDELQTVQNAEGPTEMAEEDECVCKYCKKRFLFKSVLKHHLRTHGSDSQVQFKTSRNPKRSSKTCFVAPTSEKPFCKACSKTFKTNFHLKRHMRTHPCGSQFICVVCKKYFTTKTYLKAHLRLHTGERPFECEYCKKTFAQAGYLKVHARLHTGERPYECEYCKKGFAQKSGLNYHLLTKHV